MVSSTAELVTIIDRVAQGDRDAFSDLYRATSPKLYGIVFRILRQQALSEEILQEVYVKLWQQASGFNPARASPITWMSIIARNRAIDEVRRGTLPSESEYSSSDEIRDDNLGPDRIAETREQLDRVDVCLEELDTDHQDAIRLAYVNGYSRRELAERFEQPIGSVEKLDSPRIEATQRMPGDMTDKDNTDPDEIAMQAAEYALGTLDYSERQDVAARRLTNTELDAAISHWELRLAPIAESIGDREPKTDLLPGILQRIPEPGQGSDAPVDQSAEIIQFRKKVSHWRRIAAATSLLAASLAAVVVFRAPAPDLPDQNFVAVFQRDDQQPAFLLSIDLGSKALTIQPIAAESAPDKTYQLWILEENIGPTPQSLGLLNPVDGTTQKRLDDFDVSVLKAATFGISLEPEGGSPTGKPAANAIHGYLYPVEIPGSETPGKKE